MFRMKKINAIRKAENGIFPLLSVMALLGDVEQCCSLLVSGMHSFALLQLELVMNRAIVRRALVFENIGLLRVCRLFIVKRGTEFLVEGKLLRRYESGILVLSQQNALKRDQVPRKNTSGKRHFAARGAQR